MKRHVVRLLLLVAVLLATAPLVSAQEDTGTLAFVANGEDFVRQGFVSKDGWSITFDHVYVTLARVRAYQTDPPYDPETGELVASAFMVGLPGKYTVDLAEGDENAAPLAIGEAAGAPAGYYNAVSWDMVNGDDDYTLVVEGSAEKDGEAVAFTISVETPYTYDCGAFVGDERKGIVTAEAPAEVELTFHFDHIFGDAETPMDDGLNVGAVGFDPFAALAEDGVIDVDMAALEAAMDAETYALLVEVLPTLGHTGEGHCHAH